MPIFAIIVALLPLTAKSANMLSESPANQGWLEKSFSGNTLYTLETIDNTQVVKGHAVGSASALYRNEKIDVSSTPILSWRWKVSNVFENTQEKQKSGDDFPARLYVVYQKGFFKWSTVAINYVWSSQYPVGESWNSAYTKKSKIVVLQSGSPTPEGWVKERRNIVDDFKRYFDLDVSRLNGYALMVDGDNTGSSATGWFADITFSKE
ncbi:MAG: DUF3047 domain-containing protein [Granulosicoccus sp.]